MSAGLGGLAGVPFRGPEGTTAGDGAEEDDGDGGRTRTITRGAGGTITGREEGEEEDDEPRRTIEELRTTGDPEEVDRMPVFGPKDIPVRAGEWPIGYPLQGVPRIAVTLNLNYIYDESRDEWVRDTGNRTGGGSDIRHSRVVQTGTQTVSFSSTAVIDYDFKSTDPSGDFDLSSNTYTVGEDGVYSIRAVVTVTNPDGDTDYRADIVRNGTTLIKSQFVPAEINEETQMRTEVDIVLNQGDTLQIEFVNGGLGDVTIGGSAEENYFTATRYGPLKGSTGGPTIT